ncbi:hypothetical protein Tco_0122886 [Tanacetum coccineum]
MESNKQSTDLMQTKNFYKAFGWKAYRKVTSSFLTLMCSKGKDIQDNCKSTDGSKSQHKSAGESAHTEEPMHTDKVLRREPRTSEEFDIGATKEQSDEETSQHPDWFQKLAKIPSLDHDWNKTLPATHGPVQPWLSTLAQMENPRDSINELMDTPLDISIRDEPA